MDNEARNTKKAPQDGDGNQRQQRMYLIFGAMIVTSTLVMFLLTYTNVYVFDHAYFSQERVYMAILMGAAMAIIMLGYMRLMMYRNDRLNLAIVAGAVVVGIAALVFSRAQLFIEDVDYMEGMIPHHSIAILTSERSGIEDVRVHELACGIIVAQRREIAEMAWLIEDIRENGVAETQEEADERPVPSFEASC